MFLGGDILIEILEILCRYQIYSETIANRLNIIEMSLGGDILIEIICKYQIYSEYHRDVLGRQERENSWWTFV